MEQLYVLTLISPFNSAFKLLKTKQIYFEQAHSFLCYIFSVVKQRIQDEVTTQISTAKQIPSVAFQ